jgi:hypothetical protein
VPTFWWSVVPPTPSCRRCGAVPREAHGPVIEMEPRGTRFGRATTGAPLWPWLPPTTTTTDEGTT